MNRRLIALLLALCMIFGAAPVQAGAVSGQMICANDVTVTAGYSASVTVRAENLENIAALDVFVYYDPEIFSVSSAYEGYLLNEAQSSLNTSQAGSVTLSAMSLNGISGSGNLFTVYFSTKTDCAPGTYPITVAVGRAYNTELAAVSVDADSGSVTVNEAVETETFDIYCNTSRSTLQKDDLLEYRVYNSSSREFVSGDFTVTYDHTVFAFESLELNSSLTDEGALYSVNSSVLGQVRLTYANTHAVSPYELFTVKWKVIANRNDSTTVKTQASNMYRESLTLYLPDSTSSYLYLQKLPEVTDAPNAFLKTQELVVGQESTSVFCLEAGANVAAADFALDYDPQALRCVSVEVAEGVTEAGGMVVINDHFDNGLIRFSYVNTRVYDETELPLVTITWEPLISPQRHYQVTPSGIGVVDGDYKQTALEYVADTGCIFTRTVIDPTCLEDGYTDFTCACGENHQTDPQTKLGHDIRHFEPHAPTCTLRGCDTPYDRCMRCDYTTGEMIPALDHDEIPHNAKTPTCTEIGWDAYVTCSRCDYSTYAEHAALGHRVIQTTTTTADPLRILNRDAIPFVYSGGVYYSNNHGDGSTSELTVNVLYDCTVTLHYGVSSENNYDKLIILLDDRQMALISGDVSNRSLTLQPAARSVITIRYTKDGSVSNGQDQGWVKLQYNRVTVETSVDVPTDTLFTDCGQTILCDYCKTVVNSSQPHDPVDHEGKKPTCTEGGWAPYQTCTRCNYSSYEEIKALDHDYVNHNGQKVTCTEIGWDAYQTCTRCDYSSYVEQEALDHDYVDHDPKTPTCTEIGWDAYQTCSRCDYSTYVEKKALDHDYVDHDPKTPTCTEIGWDAYQTCSRCDYTSYVEKPALDHDYIDHKAQAPSCTEIGWDAYQTCTRCNYSSYEEKKALDHDYIDHKAQAPSCTDIGWDAYQTCSRCDYTSYVEQDALDHDYVNHDPKTPTCTEIGWEAYQTCSRCDYSTYEELPKTEHPFVDGVCSVCGAPDRVLGDVDENNTVDIDDVVTLLLHVSMPDLFQIHGFADFDGNQAVDIDDVVTLLLHVSMPDIFPLEQPKQNG